jgi:hypothetical protein
MRDHGRRGNGGQEDEREQASSGGLSLRELAMRRRSVQRKARGSAAPRQSEPAPAEAGRELPAAQRQRFERSTGSDLSGVRVHTGGAAAAEANALDARAFTVGQDIHFAEGEFAPGSAAGDALLAHEVAHTVQQARGGGGGAQCKGEVSQPGDSLEVEADQAAAAMVDGRTASLSSGAGAIMRATNGSDHSAAENQAGGNHAAPEGSGGARPEPSSEAGGSAHGEARAQHHLTAAEENAEVQELEAVIPTLGRHELPELIEQLTRGIASNANPVPIALRGRNFALSPYWARSVLANAQAAAPGPSNASLQASSAGVPLPQPETDRQELEQQIPSLSIGQTNQLITTLRARASSASTTTAEVVPVQVGSRDYQIPNDALDDLQERAEAHLGLRTLESEINPTASAGRLNEIQVALQSARPAPGSGSLVEVILRDHAPLLIRPHDVEPLEARIEPLWRAAETREIPADIGPLIRVGLMLLPVVGQIISVYEIVSGRSFITGEHLSAGERALCAAALLLGSVAEELETEAMTAERILDMEGGPMRAAWIAAGRTEESADRLAQLLREIRPNLRELTSDQLEQIIAWSKNVETFHRHVEAAEAGHNAVEAAGAIAGGDRRAE